MLQDNTRDWNVEQDLRPNYYLTPASSPVAPYDYTIEYIIDQKPHCTPFLNIFVSAIFALWITNCAR
jgi:hypothetical protein